MYIADNSGEIIFDKFLLENLPLNKVTYVVKGGPIVNDATKDDAISSGVVDLVRVAIGCSRMDYVLTNY